MGDGGALEAEPRDGGDAARLRREGRVPGCLYGKGLHLDVHLPARGLDGRLGGAGAAVRVRVAGDGEYAAAVGEVQRGHLGDGLVHVSLLVTRGG